MQSQILPSRAALVDRIALQFEYGQNLIVLLGPSGLGKSYLLETFITDKYTDFNKAFVQLSARMTDAQLMSELLEQSFRSPLIDQNLSLSENFYQLAKQQNCGPCLWVLDGGRHLSDEMVQELTILAKQSPTTLYILLASQSVGQFQSSVEIHLEALSMAESKQLMQCYFPDLPYDEDPVFQTFLKERIEKEQLQNLTTRKIPYDSPGLADGEVDMVLIVNTYHHIEDRPEYFAEVKKGIKERGELVIIDFFDADIPVGPKHHKISIDTIISELKKAGYTEFEANVSLLPYQYIITAR